MHDDECAKMLRSITTNKGNDSDYNHNIIVRNGRVMYPPRYMLDIVSHKDWYDSHGVDQVFIIVLRDQNLSRLSRSESHCTNSTLLKQEEEVGTDIIIRAINKYILETNNSFSDDNQDNNRRRRLTTASYDSWYEETFLSENIDGSSSIHNNGNRKLFSSSLLSNGNNVVLVSYELLMQLQGVYIRMLYNTLGIESDYMPTIKDGNHKYVKGLKYTSRDEYNKSAKRSNKNSTKENGKR